MWNMLTSVLEAVKDRTSLSSLLTFMDNHRALTALTACSAGVSLYAAWFLKRPRNLPPGPYGYPIVGCLFSFGTEQKNNFKDVTEKYGDILTFWMGGDNYLVILNSYEAIKEVYIKSGSTFMDRDAEAMNNVFEIEDTIFNGSYNEIYKESRKITIQAMRTLITSKLGCILEAELDEIERYIDLHLGEPMDVSHWMKRVLTNTITQILFSKRYNDEDSNSLTQKLWLWNKCSATALFSVMLPWYMSTLLLTKPLNDGRKITREIMGFIKEIINQRSAIPKDGVVEDLLDAYLGQEGFTEKQIISTLFMFMPDATYTTPAMAMWMFVYLTNDPECQDEIHNEIQHVCGNGIDLTLRSQMPITESFIMEVFRIVTPFSFGVPNKPLELAKLRQYSMPDYVTMMPHIGIVHQDSRLFPEPEKFKARRFIKDGKIGNTLGFMPFGIGRRMCVGEQLVRNNIFYIVTRLMLKYRICSPNGAPLSTECEGAEFVKMPKKFSLCFKKR